jgi:hypothetical protein
MPTLTLIFKGQTLAFDLAKIDRDRLYGTVETETTTADGEVCCRATLAGDGRTLAGSGDTAIAYLSPDGSWRERGELRAVDATDGAAIVPVKSTFAFPVTLDGKETSLDDYLGHAVRLVYQLRAEMPDGNGGKFDALLDALKEATIFKFPFSYRGGDLADPAFVLLGADGEIYLAVATPCALDYARLSDLARVAADEDLAEEEEEELDFSMV